MIFEAQLDFEPIARQVYDTFLLSVPDVPVEGLFHCNGLYYIVSPALDTKLADGRTVAAWYEYELKPLGMGILLVQDRPAGAVELACRSPAQVADGFGIVRTRITVQRDLALMLPSGFPLVSITVEDRTLVVAVSRVLEEPERTSLASIVAQLGDPLPIEVRIVQDQGQLMARASGLELIPTRLHKELSTVVRAYVESDEDYWRSQYHKILAGAVRVEAILGEMRFAEGEACLVGTT